MRGVCQICTEFFEETRGIAACPCGHTFHYDCLLTWLNNSKTCPSCRSRCLKSSVVKKLYFHCPDGNEKDDDHLDKLTNELETIRAQLVQKENIVANALLQQALFEENSKAAEEQNKKLRKKFLEQEKLINSLQDQLGFLQRKAQDGENAKQEAKALRDKLTYLENVEELLSGREESVENLIRASSGGPEALKNIATVTALLQSELQNETASKKKLKAAVLQLHKDAASRESELRKQETQINSLQEKVKLLEADLEHSESSRMSLRRKFDTLLEQTNRKDRVRSRLINESPAPSTPESANKRVKLTDPNMSVDLFEEGLAENERPTPMTARLRKACHEYNVPMPTIKFAGKPDKLHLKSPSQSLPVVNGLKHFSMKNSNDPGKNEHSSLGGFSHTFKTGYDGLGGTTRNIVFNKSAAAANPFSKYKQAKDVKKKSKDVVPSLNKYLSFNDDDSS